MNFNQISTLQTDPSLLAAIRSAPAKLSASEIFEQSVSFAYGSMSRTSNVTKEQVRQVIIGQTGGAEHK